MLVFSLTKRCLTQLHYGKCRIQYYLKLEPYIAMKSRYLSLYRIDFDNSYLNVSLNEIRRVSLKGMAFIMKCIYFYDIVCTIEKAEEICE